MENDLFGIIIEQIKKPWILTQLVIVSVIALIIYWFSRLLVPYITDLFSVRFQRFVFLVFPVSIFLAWLSVVIYTLELQSVPVIFELGRNIVELAKNKLGQIMITIAVAIVLWKLVKVLVKRILPSHEDVDFNREDVRTQTLKGVIASILQVVIVIGSLISILQTLGVNVTSLLAGVSVFGIAVGFGAQNLVKDIFAGFFILLEDQYGIGDIITINETQLMGTVEKLNLRRTVIRDLDGTVHIVPNGQILTVSVSSKDWSRVVALIGISYQANIRDGLQVLETVCKDLYQDENWKKYFLEEPVVQGVTALGDNSVTLRALFKVLPKSQWDVEREFNLRIKVALDENGIEIPFPQRTISFQGTPFEIKPSETT